MFSFHVVRRAAATVLTAAAWLTGSAWAQAPAGGLVFAVSEGTSGGGAAVTDAQMATKYKPVVEVLERVLGQPVGVKYVRDFRLLEDGMKAARFDLVMARPSDYPSRGLRDYGYNAITTTQPDGHCLLVVKEDSPLKTLADLKGKRFILPEQVAYMTKFCMAELRDRGLAPPPHQVHFVREQAAIPFALQNNLSHVGGIASYSGVARRLEKEGLRVIHQSRPQPYLPLIAGARIPVDKTQELGAELAALARTEHGGKALAAIGLKGFDTGSQQRLLDLLDWLGDRKAH